MKISTVGRLPYKRGVERIQCDNLVAQLQRLRQSLAIRNLYVVLANLELLEATEGTTHYGHEHTSQTQYFAPLMPDPSLLLAADHEVQQSATDQLHKQTYHTN